MSFNRTNEKKKHFVFGKFIVGIDPAKVTHCAVVLDPYGLQQGKTFKFNDSFKDFKEKFWNELSKRNCPLNRDKVIFAKVPSITGDI